MTQKATDIRKGQIIRHDGRKCKIMTATHITPGKGVACMQVTMKDLERGNNINHRFKPADKVERLTVENVKMQYLYAEADYFVFMHTETYEQVHLSKELIGDAMSYVKPNSEIEVVYIDEQAVSIELPQKITLEITETEPGIKNASATNVMKPATTETGLVVQVPPFINTGESVIVNTESGEYVSRA